MSDGKTFILTDSVKKLFKLPDDSVIGLAGEHYNGLKLLQDVIKVIKTGEKKLPEGPYKGVEALLVTPQGQVLWYERSAWDEVKDEYTASGSGWKYAMAAMDADADAITAVKVGIKRDMFSGGKVQKVKVF